MTSIHRRRTRLVHCKDIISQSSNWFIDDRFRRYDLFYGDKYLERVYCLNLWQKIFIVADEPDSCLLAYIWSTVIIIITLISCILYILGSIRELKVDTDNCTHPVCSNDALLCPNQIICEPIDQPYITAFEKVCAIIFCMDYFLRMILCSTVPSRLASMHNRELSPAAKLELQVQLLYADDIDDDDEEYTWYLQFIYYLLKPIHIVDIMAVLPFLITSSGLSVSSKGIGVLKIFRVFRLIKIVKTSIGLQVMVQTFIRAQEALQLLIFFSFLAVIIFASLGWYLEEGNYEMNDENGKYYYYRNDLYYDKERTPYQSIPVALYWSIVTLCTVGYGDIYPTSDGGRFFACICMYIGLLVFALPISVIGSNFEKLIDDTKGATAELVAANILEHVYQKDENEDVDMIDFRLANLTELKKSFFIKNNKDDDDAIDNSVESLIEKAAREETGRLKKLANEQARKLATLAILGRGLLSGDHCDILNFYLSDLGIENFVNSLTEKDYDFSMHANELFGLGNRHENHPTDSSKIKVKNPIAIERKVINQSHIMHSNKLKWNNENLIQDLIELHHQVSHPTDRKKFVNNQK